MNTKDTAQPKKAETDVSVAELDGENIEVVHDFSQLMALVENKLALVTSSNEDVRKALSEWHFAWFTDEDAESMQMIGFRRVIDQFGDGVKALSQPANKRKEIKDIRISAGGGEFLTAYCIPRKRYDKYNEYIQQHQVINTGRQFSNQANAQAAEHAMGTTPDGGAPVFKTDVKVGQSS